MSRDRPPAPIFVDTFTLTEWILEHFDDDTRILPKTICNNTLELLEAITLALKDRARVEQTDRADERLITLRIQLRLAAARGYLNEEQLLYAIEQMDTIGRQLGGWIRALGPV